MLLIVGVPGQEVGLKGLHQAVEKVAVGHRAAERRPVLSLTKGAGPLHRNVKGDYHRRPRLHPV